MTNPTNPTNPQVNVDFLKKYLRAFCITLDQTLTRLRDAGEFEGITVVTELGKIDNFDPDQFSCNTRWLKANKLSEIFKNILSDVMDIMVRSSSKKNKSSQDMDKKTILATAITGKLLEFGMNHMYNLKSNTAIVIAVCPFELRFEFDKLKSSNLDADQKEKLLHLSNHLSNSETHNLPVAFKDDPELMELLIQQNIYCPIMNFTISTGRHLMGVYLDYDLNGIEDIRFKSKKEFYKHVYFTDAEVVPPTKINISDYISFEEVPFNLIDVEYQQP